jgi:enediyne biosynthesis protein E4
LGSRVEIVVNGVHQIREIDGGGSSHLSQNATYAHFGLGKATEIDEIIIHWTGGNVQILKNQKANQLLTITEEKTFRLHPFAKWALWTLLGFVGVFYAVRKVLLKKKS